MTPALYAKLSAQITRQTAELAAYDADIATRSPVVQALADALADASDVAAAMPDGSDKTAALADEQAAREDHAGPAAELADLQSRADAIRAAIAQCQGLIDASGMSMTAGDVAAELSRPVVPQSVTMRQARLALLGAGLLSTVDAAIDVMQEPTRSAARIEWEYSGEVHRNKALVQALAPALGLTDAQIDALFIAAAAL